MRVDCKLPFEQIILKGNWSDLIAKNMIILDQDV